MARLKSSPALLIVDMQNGFCHPSGSFSKIGIPISRHAAIIPKIARLTRLCQSHNIPIIYTRMEFNEDYSDAGLMLDGLPGIKEAEGLVRDTWDAQIVDELQPHPDAANVVVLSKTRHSAFFDTELSRLLKERDINQIIVTGVGTNVCVEATVRDSWTHGFQAITVSDATGTVSEEEQRASMTNLQHFGGSISVEELERWKEAKDSA